MQIRRRDASMLVIEFVKKFGVGAKLDFYRYLKMLDEKVQSLVMGQTLPVQDIYNLLRAPMPYRILSFDSEPMGRRLCG